MIIATDHSNRFFNAAFILAGIGFVALNAYWLADFFGRPLAKRSEGLKSVSMKWEQFTAMSESPVTDFANGALLENAREQPEPAMQPKSPQAAQPTNPLPVVSGVFQVFYVDKNSEYVAIIEGKRLKKHDRVKDFTIENITANGVVLNKNGQTLFIPAPRVFFSLGRKEENAESKPR